MANSSSVGSKRNSRIPTDSEKRSENEVDEAEFCTKENVVESLSMLSEEFEALGVDPVLANRKQFGSFEILTDTFAKLVAASWKLVCEHRLLMKKYDQLTDVHSKIVNDNTNLKKCTDRLKEDSQKKEHALQQAAEIERRLKLQLNSLTRDFKREKEETVKLKKQLRSKDNQHEHELRRVKQTGSKLRQQLEKSMETRLPKGRDKAQENTEKVKAYKETIARLEENQRHMLQEISELKYTLSLYSAGIDLHIEASGIWTDAETELG